jgi:ketosteroid isomerase-like protein
MIKSVRNHFQSRPHAFEHCAAAIARLMMPNIAALDVTRPSRDGGRDAVEPTWLDLQAYREIKEDQHPVIVIAAADIVVLLRAEGRGNVEAVSRWLAEEFPQDL